MTAHSSKTVLSLDSEAVLSLKDGINFKKSPDDAKCYIIYKENGELKACKNQCKHQGGLFIKDIEDLDGRTVRCTKHFWKLNVSTMQYVNPPDSFTQDELVPSSSCPFLWPSKSDMRNTV
uniref:Rieske domain-containing protein n=1 Tax=Hucho hucho TaxID=62062 RepID=A0A4W5QD47_9TELE